MKIRLEDLYPRVQNVIDYTDLAALTTPLTDVLYHVQSGVAQGKLFIFNGNGFDPVAGSAGITSVNSSTADFNGNVQIGGIFRGPFTPSTTYKKFDEVLYNAISHYANVDFTSADLFDITNWTNTVPTKVNNYTLVTYDQLAGLIASSSLIETTFYLISDFQTVHTFADSVGINTGPIEPILVQASSANTLFDQAASPSYPQDTIYYSFKDFNVYIPGSTKGAIYRRVDNQYNNDVPYDFRNCKFRRYLDVATNLYSIPYNRNVVNTNPYQDALTFALANYGNGQIVNNIWNTATHVPSDYSNTHFYGSVDFVCDATSVVNYVNIKDGCMIGVTLLNGSQLSTSSFIGYYFGSMTLFKSSAYGLYFRGDYSNSDMYLSNSNISYLTVIDGSPPKLTMDSSNFSFISIRNCDFGYPVATLNLATTQNNINYLNLVDCHLISSFVSGTFSQTGNIGTVLTKYFYKDKEVFTHKIGDPSLLNTTAKDSLVSAINEVNTDIITLQNNTASITNAVYTWVGDPSLNSFALVPFGLNNTFLTEAGQPGANDPDYLQPHNNKFGFFFDYNTVYHQFNNNDFNGLTLRNTFNHGFTDNISLGFLTDCTFGDNMQYNTFGDSTRSCIFGEYTYKFTSGKQVQNCKIGSGTRNITLGDSVSDCNVGNYSLMINIEANCQICDIGISCSNITLVNCNGQFAPDASGVYSRVPFLVPDSTTDKYYENNIEMPNPNDSRTKLSIFANLSDLTDKAAARANLGLLDSSNTVTTVIPSVSGSTLTITTNIGAATTTLPVPDVNKAYVDAADQALGTRITNNTAAITANASAILTKANATDLMFVAGTGNGSITSKGAGNNASGSYAVVVGGLNNTAAGNYATTDGHDNVINGLECHAYGSRGCTIAAACVRVTLINCTNLTVNTGTDLTYFNNVVNTVYPAFNPYDVSVALRISVVQSIFSTDSNELQGTQPTGSIPGMRFGWYNYDYEYKPANDGTYKWDRNYKDSSGALVPDITSFPAFNVFGGASTIANGSYLKIGLNALANFDTHNAWNGTGYVIPNTGTYQIDMTLRIADNTSLGISYGIGCDTALVSNISFGWRMSSVSGPAVVRHGASHQRTARFNQGDVVFYYGYFDGGAYVNVASAELTILRIR